MKKHKQLVDWLLLWAALTLGFQFLSGILVEPLTIAQRAGLWRSVLLMFAGELVGFRWLISGALALLFTALINPGRHTLDIALHTAGNGQYGAARWATPSERTAVYPRQSFSSATVPGFLLEYDRHGGEVDSSDRNVLLVCPPGGGKTTCVLIPTLLYNSIVNRNTHGGGASILSLDSKGEEYAATHAQLEADGYRCLLLDFRHPLRSPHINLLHPVNAAMDIALDETRDEQERLRERARAERQAKIFAAGVYAMAEQERSAGGGENSAYFAQTAQGLVTAVALIVSEFGAPDERHIVSVFQLIIELNGLVDDGKPKNALSPQKNRLAKLMELLPGDLRARLYAGGATGADVRTSMNIFSSALATLLRLLDAEVEQMICEQDEGFTAEEIVKTPTCLYLIMPDEDSTTHAFASLYIMQTGETLVRYASELPGNRLNRPLYILWDEFGQAPRCKDAEHWLNAWRSRRIRFLLALQSEDQLETTYGTSRAKVMRKAIQVRMYSNLAADDTAQELSRELGNYTIATGSTTQSSRRDGDSSSRSLAGRALMTPDEIATMPRGTWLVLANQQQPLKARLQPYTQIFRHLAVADSDETEALRPVRPIAKLTEAKLQKRFGAQENDNTTQEPPEEASKVRKMVGGKPPGHLPPQPAVKLSFRKEERHEESEENVFSSAGRGERTVRPGGGGGQVSDGNHDGGGAGVS